MQHLNQKHCKESQISGVWCHEKIVEFLFWQIWRQLCVITLPGQISRHRACLCSQRPQSSGSISPNVNNTLLHELNHLCTWKLTRPLNCTLQFTSGLNLHYFMCVTLLRQSFNTITWLLIHKTRISHRKFISIFIVFRNPRIKSFLVFFPLPFTTGKNEGQAIRHAFSSRRDALQDGLKWKGREGKRYIKCFCQQFSSFNRKKDQNKRFEGGGRGHGGPWTWQYECMWRRWRRWQFDEEEEWLGVFIFKK